MRDDAAHRLEHLDPVVDEARDPEFRADCGLLRALPAEMQGIGRDPGALEEAALAEPDARARLNARTAFRDQPDSAVEERVQTSQRLEGTGYGGHLQSIGLGAANEGGVRTLAVDDDAAD